MTPKEKAFELYLKMIRDVSLVKETSKLACIILVNEILLTDLKNAAQKHFWVEVKKEIKLL